MSIPAISVVMPVHNGASFLEPSICSILEQTFSDIELIIVDDGSTDQTGDIVRRLANKDSRIKWYRQEHVGLVEALNKGCSVARSEYIARMDCDDVAIPHRLEIQMGYMRQNREICLIGGAIECIDLSGQKLFVMKWPSWDGGLHDYLLVDCCISHPTVLFRKHNFIELGGYRSQYLHAEDYDLFLRFSDFYRVENTQAVLCQYRLHDGQVSVRTASQQVVSAIGARLATKMRRRGMPEPRWTGRCVTYRDLRRLGINSKRIRLLTEAYLAADANRERGWRWPRSEFLEFDGCPDGGR